MFLSVMGSGVFGPALGLVMYVVLVTWRSDGLSQNDPAGTTCTLANLAQRIGVTAGTGLSGDGRWAVAITPVTLNVATNQFGGGPLEQLSRVVD